MVVLNVIANLTVTAPSWLSRVVLESRSQELLVVEYAVVLVLLALVSGLCGLAYSRARTQSKRLAQKELEQAAILRAIPDLLFVLDSRGKFLEYHGCRDKSLFIPPDQFIGKHYSEVLPAEHVALLTDTIQDAIATGDCVQLEYPGVPGSDDWFEARVLVMEDGRILVLSRNNSDRKRVIDQAKELHGLRLALNEHTLFSITDKKGIIVDVNDGFCRISGYSREELIGQSHRLLNSGTHSRQFWNQMWRTIVSGNAWRAEVCNRAKDGSLYWVDSTNIPIANASGEIERFISLRFDITDRKHLEEEKRSSEVRYQSLVANIPGITYRCRCDEDWTMLFISDIAEQITGYPATDFVGNRIRTYASVIHPADREFVYQGVTEAVKNGTCWDIEYRICHRNGAVRWVQEKGRQTIADEAGEICLDGFVFDITERIETRQRMKSIYDAVAEGIVLLDRDGFIIDCNPAAVEILGVTKEQICSRTPGDVRWRAIREDGTSLPAEEMPALISLRTGQSIRSFIHGIVRPDDTTRWLSVSSEPICDAQGAICGVVASVADMTVQYLQSQEIANQKRILESVLDSWSTGYWEWDLATKTAHYSTGWLRMLGYASGDLEQTFDLWRELIHPDDLEVVEKSCEAHCASRGAVPFYNRVRFKHRSGEIVWVLFIGRVVEWAVSGQPIRMAGCHIDISDAQRAEQLVIRQRAELQGILDAIPGVVIYKDADNTILELNRTAAQLLGSTKEGIRGRKAAEFSQEAAGHPCFADDRAILQSGQARLGIVGTQMTDQGVKHIRSDKIPVADASGNFDRLVSISTDITEFIEANEQVREAECRLDLAMRASNTGLWEWDIDSGVTYFSETWFTMLGYRPGELPMSIDTWCELCHPDDFLLAQAALLKHFCGESPVYCCEHRLRCSDGSWMWVRGVGEVIEQNLDGSPRKAVGVNIDIQELRNAVIRAEDANRAKSDFLANMSHELRTPLTAILGYADLLLEPAVAEVNSASCAKTVKANADHLLTIINDILDMSKIEAGQMRVEKIAIDPVHLLEDIVKVLKPRALGKGISLAIEFDSPIPTVIHSDPTRLRQVLLNLVGNAVKFTEVGGVTIRVVCYPEKQILRMDVIDTGIGMNAEQRAEISRFNAFTQADTSTTRRFGGTGLGLRISNTLAKMLGGGIEIESEEGKGSVFSVTIDTGCLHGIRLEQPRCAGKQSRPEEEVRNVTLMAESVCSDAQPKLPLEGIRILLAEDGPDNQRLISFHLKKAGAEVKIVENGLLAAEWVEQANAAADLDLILMDMQMPVLDGYDATRRLRRIGCRLPIIALTAHAMEGDRQKCIEAGCDEYLTKPIDKSLLVATCQQAAVHSGSLQTS